jgi:hypothetical protein
MTIWYIFSRFGIIYQEKSGSHGSKLCDIVLPARNHFFVILAEREKKFPTFAGKTFCPRARMHSTVIAPFCSVHSLPGCKQNKKEEREIATSTLCRSVKKCKVVPRSGRCIAIGKTLPAKNIFASDHSLLPGVDVMKFLPIFGEKMAFSSKTNVMITIFAKTSSSLSKKRQYFR